jgi:hypothetical protein
MFKFEYLSSVSKDVKTRGYFSKPEGVRKQTSLGSAAPKPNDRLMYHQI